MNKILVVDDHKDIRKLLAITLDHEYEVVEAADGLEALQIAQREKPFAVLLDIMMMGELDGLQVLRAIRADPHIRNTLVALVSARGQEADIELGKRCGADGYFVKPFSPLQIIAWLHRHHDRAAAAAAAAASLN